MSIGIYLGGTTGAADGTLEVPGDGTGLTLGAVGSVGTIHLRASSGNQNAEQVTVNAPTDCEVSADGVTYGATAVYAIGAIQDVNVAVYVKRTAGTTALTTGGTTTPRLAAITEEVIPVPDVTVPVLSGTLVATAGDTQVTLSGPTATDAAGIAKWQYRIGTGEWMDIAESNNTTMPSTVVGSLTNDTEYSFTVRALDAAGNASNVSNAATATPEVGDTTAPAIAGTLTATPTATQGQVTLEGPTATDNVGITKWQYQVDAGAWVDVASTSTTFPSTTVSGLSDGLHTFAVRAVDAAANASSAATTSARVGLFAGTYDFTGAVGSAPPSIFTVQTAGNGTAALDGNGFLKLYTAATTDGATAGLTDPILKETRTYKRKFRATAPTTAAYVDILQVSGRATRPPIGPGADSLSFNDFGIGFNIYDQVFPSLSSVSLFHKSITGTQYWWNQTNSTWDTTPTVVEVSLNTDYVAILETTATQARLTLKDSTETTTLIQCQWLDWSVIRNNTSNLWLWWGDISNTSRYATTLDDSFSVD